MPKLPDVLDYGQRPSLRTNRVDLPGNAALITGDALANAAEKFVAVAEQHKEKKDAFNYALAKNELLQADIREREKLKDDQDWATHDERYRTGYKSSRDEVFNKYSLDPRDAAVLDAEANLITERGAVNVGERARRIKIDEGMARLDQGLDAAREAIQVADPMTRNDLLLTQLDAITAAETSGFLGETEAQAKRQAFTQDVSIASLVGMDPKDREKALEQSLAQRKAGGPLSPDDIRAGKGTGSIADFLHFDTATKLLKQTKKENEISDELEVAYRVTDAAVAKHPEDPVAQMKYIRDQTRGMDAKIRARAESIGRSRGEEQRVADGQVRQKIMQSAGELMRDDGWTYDQLPSSELAKLSPGQDAELQRYDRMLRNNKQFADVTNWHDEKRDENGDLVQPAYSTWAKMSPEEKAKQDLTLPMWHTNFTNQQWKQFSDEQNQIRSGSSKGKDDPVQTNDQLLQSVLVGSGMLPATGRSDAQNASWQRIRSRMSDEIRMIQEQKYGGQKAPYEERKSILLNILAEQAWVRDEGWFGFDADLDEGKPLVSLTPKQMKSGFVPIEVVRGSPTTIDINGTPVTMTWEQRLINRSKAELNGRIPDQKDIENAYFAIAAGMSDAEVNRRLAGKGDK